MPLRGVREVKTHAAARRVGSHLSRTPLRGVWKVKIRRCEACQQ